MGYDFLVLDFVSNVAMSLAEFELLEDLHALVVDVNLHRSNKTIYHQHFPTPHITHA